MSRYETWWVLACVWQKPPRDTQLNPLKLYYNIILQGRVPTSPCLHSRPILVLNEGKGSRLRTKPPAIHPYTRASFFKTRFISEPLARFAYKTPAHPILVFDTNQTWLKTTQASKYKYLRALACVGHPQFLSLARSSELARIRRQEPQVFNIYVYIY
jgi:hypothetical protein